MQFQNNWNSTFDRIVQGIQVGNEGLCQSQINQDVRPNVQRLAIARQQCRAYRVEQLPISELFPWEDLKTSENVQLKRFRQSVYYGEIIDTMRCGKGIMLYTNGRVFEGQWKDNFKHGKGFEKFHNGIKYNGTYVNGKPEGYGVYTWDNGETYEGELVDGQKHGSGIWRGPNGDSYIGQWKQGQANGYGVHTWVNGDRYEGEFKNCFKHGEGIQKFANGDSYKGMYLNGKPQGFGEYYWSTGSYFKGNFKNGLRQGKGIWKRGPGGTDKYDGQYKDDKKDGFGIFTYQNGNMYKGNFVNDLRQGYGQMYFVNGNIFRGSWEQGQQVSGQMQQPQKVNQQDQQAKVSESEVWYNNIPKRQASQGCTRMQKKYPVNNLSRKHSNNQVLEMGSQFFLEGEGGNYQQPNHPSLIDAQKRFRARGINSKKSSRPILESQKTTRSFYSCNNKIMIRVPESAPKKMRQGHSENKIMSSTYFSQKSNGINVDNHTKPRGRMVKTSGGMRQKHISEEIKYFTRNKITPEYL